MSSRIFLINNIKLPINASVQEAFSVALKKLSRAGLPTANAEFAVFRRSTDARNKRDIMFVYAISAIISDLSRLPETSVLERYGIGLIDAPSVPTAESGTRPLSHPPLIVGSGPAGLFAALYLAERGYEPVLIERGGSINERKTAVDRFVKSRILDAETNIQFGAGGAGTFSDGKLVTRINDPFTSYVLSRLVDFGAPREILYLARPHIGTDVLAPIIERILDEIVRLGGSVYYHTKYIRSVYENGSHRAVTNNGDIPYGALILATGHSARDTYRSLIDGGFSVEAKQFSVGMRIEHLTEDIDTAMYGDHAGNEKLGHAEYNLSHNTKVRGVYTFCMCPGGEVIAAASESDGVVVNGMSSHARAGRNSNSAVVCTVFKEDYGATPEAAIEFQRSIERAAYRAAGADHSAPIVTVGDFTDGTAVHSPSKVLPTYMDGRGVRIISPELYLPKFITDAIRGALPEFDKRIRGFAAPHAVLTGAETRTSSPVRILRDPQTRLALGTSNIYPCGEGAGYAGGITSAAIDGIRSAMKIAEEYMPIRKN